MNLGTASKPVGRTSLMDDISWRRSSDLESTEGEDVHREHLHSKPQFSRSAARRCSWTWSEKPSI